ncbi:MAG: tetratricopeptide repeat protein [Ornithinimicrobium sp.]
MSDSDRRTSPARDGERRRSGSGAGDGSGQGPARSPEPELPDHLTADLADRSIHRELRTLSKENAEGVARHLLAVSESLDAEDFDRALAHAKTAVRRAGRVPIAREMLGVVHYRRAEWSKALSEFRTARRMSGSHHLLPLMADTERGLGRPERAIEMANSAEARTLNAAERMELAVVVSGARLDLGQTSAAVQSLRDAVGTTQDKDPWAARVFYAYADALKAAGKSEEAQRFLKRAAETDQFDETDAAERLGEDVEETSGDSAVELWWDLDSGSSEGEKPAR